MNDEARVIDALQAIQDYCLEEYDCTGCCLCTKDKECALANGKKPEEWEIWTEVRL